MIMFLLSFLRTFSRVDNLITVDGKPIFYEKLVTHPVAEQRCQAQGATLSGLQNQLELLYVTYTVTNEVFPGTGSVWIGLKRTEACENSTTTSKCRWDNSFEWTDKSATGIDGINWATYQPDNSKFRLRQHCVVLNIFPAGWTDPAQNGLMDDVRCGSDSVAEVLTESQSQAKVRDITAFICGKKPSVQIN
ncbi:hypothetical protein B9Z55_007251 [Caenorhabditis nigoni]|uniref:C-type lectin domain-containing protein n=2 Tax=Caenorhabditis nigoni TaxID=1611254 RepID=A0A2G5V8R5_9PELO|nr:hypothetical protein B9Z55_007251 [Caenorhabditis nigoni]